LAGIYIHIPFCKHKCNYCNFFSLATARFRDEFFQALLKEIELTAHYLKGEQVETIYFGGGTPSLFSVGQLEEIIERASSVKCQVSSVKSSHQSAVHSLQSRVTKSDMRTTISELPEITLEMNPDDITPEYLEVLSSSAINRVSLGVQSFFDEDLNYLERSHDAKQAKSALKMILDAGCRMPDAGYRMKISEIENVSVDLIYGIPTLSNNHWKQNLQILIDPGIPHISAYALTVEPKTPLAWQIKKNIRQPVSDNQASAQFEILMEMMDNAGYVHYEISNFCLPGYESVHNSNYWKGVPYLGLGPSAHSFNGRSRRWNTLHLTSYIQGIQSDNPQFEEEFLTLTQQYNEYIMTSLRTMWGCDTKKIREDFGEKYETHFRHQAIRHLASGHLKDSSGIFTLTTKGKFLADGISADLFFDD